MRGQRPFIVLSVIPEIFYRESMLLLFLWFLNTYGPRLEDCRGDEEVGIQMLSNTVDPS